MKRLVSTLALALAGVLWLPGAAQADYGLETFDTTFTAKDGTPVTQAGAHPYAMTTSFLLNSHETGNLIFGVLPEFAPDAEVKDLIVQQVAGFVGDATAIPTCSNADFFTSGKLGVNESNEKPLCPDNTAIGEAGGYLFGPPPSWAWTPGAVFNLNPPPGVATRIGTVLLDQRIVIDVRVKESGEVNLVATTAGFPQTFVVFGGVLELWGNPSDPSHDKRRGDCARGGGLGVSLANDPVDFGAIATGGNCPYTGPKVPFLTLPRSCQGPVATEYETDSWQQPGVFVGGSVLTHDDAEPPNPKGFTGCGKLGFHPSIGAEPTARAAQSPTGLDFSLDVNDEGLKNPEGLPNTDIRKAVVTLPEGMSANPSLAEGLGVCTQADLARETVNSEPGEGCPNASKIGTVDVESQLIDEDVKGSLFIAKPYENPFSSLLAMYVVIKNPTLGIIVKQPLKVEPDPQTGRLTTVADDLPQLPFSHFRLHFREGTRSPLTTPPTCGDFSAKAVLYPWSGGDPVTTFSTFEIVSGANNSPCPTGGLPPFHPGLSAGTVNNRAGSFSPFNLRLSRSDGEQEITHFSIKLPPGITGKLAGVPFCSDAQIAQAVSRTGPLGGHEEQASPSCPAASQVGRTLAGSGVGPALTYAPGKVYLAGPYHGAPISVVAITSGVVGPFDIGTVVVREGLKVNPETGEVFVDATGSDPIPHIIQGIPIHLRDIRIYMDRSQFVLNPTSCERTSTASTVLGSGLDFVSETDDNPLTVTSPFQAADCAALPFDPKLSLRLIGGTNRGAHPKLVANLKMNGIGEAGIAKGQVTLPHSEFIENSHFKTICTRVQFKAGAGGGAQCPPGSIYGYAKALTPILDEALEGPIFLRSSERELPDVVAALHSTKINVDLVGHVDSVKGGGIRNTFESVPDAPVTSATFTFAGKSKGLFVNSTNLCKATHRATVEFTGQNGKQRNYRPALQVKCAKKRKAGKGNSRAALRHKRAVR